MNIKEEMIYISKEQEQSHTSPIEKKYIDLKLNHDEMLQIKYGVTPKIIKDIKIKY